MPLKRYALIMLFLATPVHAQWAPQTYSAEYDACVPPCDKNNPTDHEKCAATCKCVMDNLQTQFPDHNQFVRETMQEKLPNRLATLRMITDTCNQKSWGNPAPRPIEPK
jgi:hypothetical protein